jgi:hypothetical protein
MCIGTKFHGTDAEWFEDSYHIVERGIYVEFFHRNISSQDETMFLLV